MATHGHVVFYEMNGSRPVRPIHCYTWHDGHRMEAINDLLDLPFKIFNKQKNASLRAYSTPEDLSGVAEGYWVYDQHMEFALSYIEENKLFQRKPWDRAHVYDNWFAMIPLQTCSLSYATWFCQTRFNRWNVVPNVKWCSYPGPDMKVYCTSGRMNGYTIEIDFEKDKEYADESEKILTDKIAALNALLPNPTFDFTSRNGQEIVINCHYQLSRDENTLRIVVPFDPIWCELFWKDVDAANKVIDTNEFDKVPYLKSVVAGIKQRYAPKADAEDALIDQV